jgi:hypothetical protein
MATEDEKLMLPIDTITIWTQQNTKSPAQQTEHFINGHEILGVIEHDINEATLTVTFCNVTAVEIGYKHNRGK